MDETERGDEGDWKNCKTWQWVFVESMGRVYLPTNLPYKSTIHIGKYTAKTSVLPAAPQEHTMES